MPRRELLTEPQRLAFTEPGVRSSGGDAGASGPWCSDAAGVWRGSDQAIDAAACGDELEDE